VNDPASRPATSPDGRSGVVHVLGSGDGFRRQNAAAALHDDTVSAAWNGVIVRRGFRALETRCRSAGTMARKQMTTAVKAIYENDVFIPREPVDLPERTGNRSRLRKLASYTGDDAKNGKQRPQVSISTSEMNPRQQSLPCFGTVFSCSPNRSECRVQMVTDLVEQYAADHEVAQHLNSVDWLGELFDDLVDDELDPRGPFSLR
jgi:predicted DNA-binding antitoxin AbrB/MazE fold protein